MAACACGSGRPYAICCRPWHQGGEPPEPVALVRSRFAAYALGQWAYLWRTLDRDHVERTGDEASFVARLAEGSRGLVFKKLLIIASAPRDDSGRAHVLFHADIRAERRQIGFAEHSRFRHDGVGWRYESGDVLDDRQVPRPLPELTFDSFAHACRR